MENFVQLPTIARNTCPEAPTSNFICHCPGPLPSGNALGIDCCITTASETASNYGAFLWCFFCMWPCHPPGQCRANTRPVTASSGFEWSPGPPPLVNVSNASASDMTRPPSTANLFAPPLPLLPPSSSAPFAKTKITTINPKTKRILYPLSPGMKNPDPCLMAPDRRE